MFLVNGNLGKGAASGSLKVGLDLGSGSGGSSGSGSGGLLSGITGAIGGLAAKAKNDISSLINKNILGNTGAQGQVKTGNQSQTPTVDQNTAQFYALLDTFGKTKQAILSGNNSAQLKTDLEAQSNTLNQLAGVIGGQWIDDVTSKTGTVQKTLNGTDAQIKAQLPQAVTDLQKYIEDTLNTINTVDRGFQDKLKEVQQGNGQNKDYVVSQLQSQLGAAKAGDTAVIQVYQEQLKNALAQAQQKAQTASGDTKATLDAGVNTLKNLLAKVNTTADYLASISVPTSTEGQTKALTQNQNATVDENTAQFYALLDTFGKTKQAILSGNNSAQLKTDLEAQSNTLNQLAGVIGGQWIDDVTSKTGTVQKTLNGTDAQIKAQLPQAVTDLQKYIEDTLNTINTVDRGFQDKLKEVQQGNGQNKDYVVSQLQSQLGAAKAGDTAVIQVYQEQLKNALAQAQQKAQTASGDTKATLDAGVNTLKNLLAKVNTTADYLASISVPASA